MKTHLHHAKTAAPWLSRLCILILASCLSSVGPLIAQDRPSAPSTLRVGVSPVFPPMVFKQGKDLAGAEVDLARAFGEKLGRKVVFVEVPWAEQIEALRDGRTDMIMSSMSITLARQSVVDFSRPYLIVGQMALVRRDDQHRYLLGFSPRLPGTVGVLKATTGEFLVQRDFPQARRKVFTSEADAVKALKKKRIDLFFADSTLIWYLAGLNASEGLGAVPRTLTEEQLAWAVRKGDDKLLAAANDFIQKAPQEGTFNRIFRRWMAISP